MRGFTTADYRHASLANCRRYFERLSLDAVVDLIDSGDLDKLHEKAEQYRDTGRSEDATVLIVAAARIRGGSR